MKDIVSMETVSSADMVKPEDCLSKTATYYHNFIYAIYHWMIFEHEQGFLFSKKLLFDDNSSILPNDYINGILQYITSSVCLGKFNDTLNGISFAQAYIEEYKLNQSAVYNNLVFTYHATYRLVVQMYIGNKEQLLEAIRYVNSGLERHAENIQTDMRQIILGNLMVAYMAMDNYDKADEIWKGLFRRQSQQVRQDVYADLYLFRLFRLLHEKRYGLLYSAALSASRYFEKLDAYADVEYPISLLLLKDRDYDKTEILREVLDSITATVTQFIRKVNGINGFQEHYTRYVIWADAILHEEPYYLAAQRWYAGFQKG